MAIPQITTKEIYKGQLYANITATQKINTRYNTTTSLAITNTKVSDKITIHEGADVFATDESKVTVNTKYISTKINKEKMLKIFDDKVNIQIKNGETVLNTITSANEADEEGNIVTTYAGNYSELDIVITGNPIATGILEIYHDKEITGNQSYDRNDLKQVKTLKAQNTTLATMQETNIVTNSTEQRVIELKETISKAKLTIENDKTNLATTETNELILGITLVTDGTQYDLFENPKITLQMPEAVENVDIKSIEKFYDDASEFGKPGINIIKEQNILEITLNGKQNNYPETSLYIQLKLDVTLSKLATTENDKIIMTYTNANATQYHNGGVVEQPIKISAQTGLLKFFNLSSNEDTSLTNPITKIITEKGAGTEISFETILVNNTGADINNVKILGKLPTTGIGENTFETTLKTLTAQNATIYFTENSSATIDIEDEKNGWTTNIATLTNAKLYLIKLDTLAQGDNYTALAKVQLPSQFEEDLQSYTQYEVIYDVEGDTKTEGSRIIWLKTASELDVDLTAQVGNELLKNEDKVKEGQVIKYTATVTNNTGKTLENVELKANIPEGTVLVEPVEMYVYSVDPFYYEEKTDVNEKFITIPTLAPEETYTTQYEVRVKMDAVTTVTEISNKAIATHGDLQKESKEIKNILENSDIRVTIKRADDESVQLISGHIANYNICVENFSNKELKDIELQVISDEYKVISIMSYEDRCLKDNAIYEGNKISINKIPANGNITFLLYGEIVKDVEKLNIYVNVADANKSNIVTEELPHVEAEITLSSPQNNESIKQNQQVIYDINVKNVGETIDGEVIIEDVVPDYLSVESISINGEIKLQTIDNTNKNTYVETISNEIKYFLVAKIGTGETLKMTIATRVKEIPIEQDGEVITNKANLVVYNVHEATSQEVKHTLNSEQKNHITGLVWLDENANGRKDDDESTLGGVKVKVYDISTNSYLSDDETVISATTAGNGQYELTKIPNGSYIIVFDHQLENYEPTKLLTGSNSKAQLYDISINGEIITVAGIEIKNLQDNITNMDIGLTDKKEEVINPEQPEDPEQPENPEEPENPEDPENPEQPEIPVQPENPDKPEDKKSISGFAWLDVDRDGQKDTDETVLSGIKVRFYDSLAKSYLKDENGNIIETTTDSDGKYTFNNIEKGLYILLFEYDTEEYEPTSYYAEGVNTELNSKVILKKIEIDGKELILAVTDTINVQDNVANINIGLKEKLIFDLELNKYISRIVIQTSKETKAYDYDNKTFAKVEIHRKQLNGSLVVLEYTIKVKNNGEMAGYAKNIVDYLPSGLTFSSELNKDWYLSGNYLYTKGLENVEINPGEEKEIKLILTKAMTNENTGLVNNRAEIYQDYNKYGDMDIDSTPNNQVQDEDDMGSVDVIILVSTGGSITAYVILLMLNVVLIGIAIKLMIKNRIIKISTKRGRR